jgi:hypothetical protein
MVEPTDAVPGGGTGTDDGFRITVAGLALTPRSRSQFRVAFPAICAGTGLATRSPVGNFVGSPPFCNGALWVCFDIRI